MGGEGGKRPRDLGRAAYDAFAMRAMHVVFQHLLSNQALACRLRFGLGSPTVSPPRTACAVFLFGSLAHVDAYFFALKVWKRKNEQGEEGREGGD